MKLEEMVLETMLGKPSNTIKFLHGGEKKLVESLMGARFVKMLPKILHEQKINNVKEVANLINTNITFAKGIKSKYVYYNGRIFVDCFAPGWPGKAFSRMTREFIKNNSSPISERSYYIPSLIISITKKCVYRCEHCYAAQTLGGTDVVSPEQILKGAKDFQKQFGVAVLAWEGGEPLLRFEELLTLIRGTRKESEALLATTAYGLTIEKAQRLRNAGLDTAIISLDHYEPDKHNKFRGNKKAFDMAVEGVRIFRENGVLPSICICVTREIMEEDGLWKYMELAKEIGVGFVQILDATPSGNYLGQDVMLTLKQFEEISKFHLLINTDSKYADYPGVQARAYLEDETNFGCGAGFSHCYIDSSGNFQSCVLLQASFGNIYEEGVEVVMKRMRSSIPYPTRNRCPAQSLHKDFYKAHEEHGSLPLPYEKCEHIFEKIRSRKLPDRYDG